MKTNNIAFVIPTLANGGAERVVAVLSSALAHFGQKVSIIKYFDEENEYPVDASVQVLTLCKGGATAYKDVSYFKKVSLLRNSIKSVRPDFIFPFMFSVAQTVYFASLGLKTQVFQSIRINPAIGPASKRQRFLRDRLVYRSKCTFVQNEQQRQYFKESARKKIHVLYNPVSDELFDVIPNYNHGEYVICSAGRLENQKNFKLLIDAFAMAFGSITGPVLRIYGEGSRRDELVRHIEQGGLQDRVFLMGRTNNIKEVYCNADLFVLSSDFEGMPNALLEAMACGLPCVSTDCPTGPADLIENGKDGLLVPIRDVQELSKAMSYMYSNQEEAHAIGVRAKETIRQKCQAESIARKMIEICESTK